MANTSHWFPDDSSSRSEFVKTKKFFLRKCLTAQLSYCSRKIKGLIHQFADRNNILRSLSCLPSDLCKHFTQKLHTDRRNHYNKLMEGKNRKLNNIKQDFFKRNNLSFHDNWFKNLTDVNFPLEIKWMLSLGPNFALPVEQNNIPLFKLIADAEDCIRCIEDEKEKEIARARVTLLLSKAKQGSSLVNYNEIDKTILKIHSDVISFLKQHKDIVIVKADKGGATVAMTKTEYQRKILEILSDTSTFVPVNSDPRLSLENKSVALIKRLRECNAIDESTQKRMTRHNTHIPRIYALPKIHKADVPLRHIVSTIDSAASQLSIYLDKIIR